MFARRIADAPLESFITSHDSYEYEVPQFMFLEGCGF